MLMSLGGLGVEGLPGIYGYIPSIPYIQYSVLLYIPVYTSNTTYVCLPMGIEGLELCQFFFGTELGVVLIG